MGTVIPWVVWISAVALWGIVIGGIAVDGITQVSTGGRGFLPLERWFRKRRPAMPGDFVLQGARQLVLALGLTFIATPLTFIGLVATTTLTTGWRPPSLSEMPIAVSLTVLGLYILSLTFGFFCTAYAYLISRKVGYVSIGTEVSTVS